MTMPSHITKEHVDKNGAKEMHPNYDEDNIAKYNQTPCKVTPSKRKQNNIGSFFGKREKISATSKSSKLLLTISLEPTPLLINQMASLQPSDSKFQMYVEIDKSGVEFEYPLSEEVLLLDQLSDKMTKLKSTVLDPDIFFDKAIEIEISLAQLK